jgi:hypothetical protein
MIGAAVGAAQAGSQAASASTTHKAAPRTPSGFFLTVVPTTLGTAPYPWLRDKTRGGWLWAGEYTQAWGEGNVCAT